MSKTKSTSVDWFCGFVFLLSNGFFCLPLWSADKNAPTDNRDALSPYVRKLYDLHDIHKRILGQSAQMIATDTELQQKIAGNQYAAIATNKVARSIPQAQLVPATVPDNDPKSKSTSRDRDDNPTKTVLVPQSNAPQKTLMAMQAGNFARLAQQAQSLRGQNAEAYKKLQDDADDNLNQMRLHAEPFNFHTAEELNEAVIALSNFLVEDPTDVGALWVRGTALAQLGRMKEARADFDKAAADSSPIQPVALSARGYVLSTGGQQQEGTADLQKGVAAGVKAKFTEPLIYRAIAACDAGKLPAAQTDLTNSLRSDPNCVPAYRLQAVLSCVSDNPVGNPERGIKAAQKAVELTYHRDWTALATLAAAQAAAGSFDTAAATQAKALNLIPDEMHDAGAQRLELYRLHKSFLTDWKDTGKLLFDPSVSRSVSAIPVPEVPPPAPRTR